MHIEIEYFPGSKSQRMISLSCPDTQKTGKTRVHLRDELYHFFLASLNHTVQGKKKGTTVDFKFHVGFWGAAVCFPFGQESSC